LRYITCSVQLLTTGTAMYRSDVSPTVAAKHTRFPASGAVLVVVVTVEVDVVETIVVPVVEEVGVVVCVLLAVRVGVNVAVVFCIVVAIDEGVDRLGHNPGLCA
jgi:hypothetical protein